MKLSQGALGTCLQKGIGDKTVGGVKLRGSHKWGVGPVATDLRARLEARAAAPGKAKR